MVGYMKRSIMSGALAAAVVSGCASNSPAPETSPEQRPAVPTQTQPCEISIWPRPETVAAIQQSPDRGDQADLTLSMPDATTLTIEPASALSEGQPTGIRGYEPAIGNAALRVVLRPSCINNDTATLELKHLNDALNDPKPTPSTP